MIKYSKEQWEVWLLEISDKGNEVEKWIQRFY